MILFDTNDAARREFAYAQIRQRPPQTRTIAHDLIVDRPRYWPGAAQLVSTGTTLDAPSLKQNAVLCHFGQALAQSHMSPPCKLNPETNLEVTCTAESLWQRLAQRRDARSFSSFEPASACKIIAYLGHSLWHSTPERVLCDRNLRPNTMMWTGTGSIEHRSPDAGYGYHPWFEPLCHFDFSAQLEHKELELLVRAYAQQREELTRTDIQRLQLHAKRCRTLFDLIAVGRLLENTPAASSLAYEDGDALFGERSKFTRRPLYDLQLLSSMDPEMPDIRRPCDMPTLITG